MNSFKTLKSFKSLKSLKPPPSSSPAARERKEVGVEQSEAVERLEHPRRN